MPLTRRQKEILDYIGSFIEEWGYAPSFEEIAKNFGYASLATVHEHLSNLERKGYIRKAYNESRSLGSAPRLRWTYDPLGDLFVSFNHNMSRTFGSDPQRWRYENDQVQVKIQHALRW